MTSVPSHGQELVDASEEMLQAERATHDLSVGFATASCRLHVLGMSVVLHTLKEAK